MILLINGLLKQSKKSYDESYFFSSVLEADISIISYGLLSWCRDSALTDVINRAQFGVAILDESHYIKNSKSSRFTRVKKALAHIPHVILLSGTPSLARPVEVRICHSRF